MNDKPWLKYYDHWVPPAITYPHMPLSRLLIIASIVYPRNVATVFYDAELTYMQLREQVTRLAAALEDLGLKKGDHIAIMLPNSPPFVIAFYAIQWIGATVVNMSPLWVEREVHEVIETSGAVALITENALAGKAAGAREHTALEHVITVGLEEYMPPEAAQTYIAGLEAQGLPDLPDAPWRHRWVDLIQTAPRPFDVEIDPEEDVAVLQYTGGTTGKLKAAMLTHYNIVANLVQMNKWGAPYNNEGNETLLCVIPFAHIYGLNAIMNRAIFHGYRMVLVPQLDVNVLADLIEQYHPTHFYAVPALLRAVLGRRHMDQAAVKSIKFVTAASSPLPRDLMIRYESQMDGMFTEGYGLTEACPLVTLWPIFNEPNRDSVGLPVPDVRIRIMDPGDAAREMPAGEVGEITVNGPQVMKGYWNEPEETAQVLRADPDGARWLYTGDLGYMDATGCLYVVGRKKHMIKVAGFNVYPNEIEHILEEHPAVSEAAVIGVPDKMHGERILAYVVRAPGAEVAESELLDFCKTNLSPYKVPRRLTFRESLPKNGVGKVLHKELIRQELESGKRKGRRPDFAAPTVDDPDIAPEAYFCEILPRAFADYVAAHPPGDEMEGTRFVVQYTVNGDVFSIHITDGRRMTVRQAPAERSTIASRIDLASWRDSVTGRVFTGLAPIAMGATAPRLAMLKDAHGTVHLELARPDGSLYRASITYNGDTATAVTVQMSADDYSAMSRGEINGVEALLSGRLRATGDISFLQVLASLRE
ncbi:MAG: AMP-binding protein [Anaerolineae bacterium]|nr:AMP-binding protein [Anaerolineae bacterium]